MGEAPTDPRRRSPPGIVPGGGDEAGRYRQGGSPQPVQGGSTKPRKAPQSPLPAGPKPTPGRWGGKHRPSSLPSAPPTHLGGAVEGEGGPTPARPRGQPLPRRLPRRSAPLRTRPGERRGRPRRAARGSREGRPDGAGSDRAPHGAVPLIHPPGGIPQSTPVDPTPAPTGRLGSDRLDPHPPPPPEPPTVRCGHVWGRAGLVTSP